MKHMEMATNKQPENMATGSPEVFSESNPELPKVEPIKEVVLPKRVILDSEYFE